MARKHIGCIIDTKDYQLLQSGEKKSHHTVHGNDINENDMIIFEELGTGKKHKPVEVKYSKKLSHEMLYFNW